jgi:hypothetical protein
MYSKEDIISSRELAESLKDNRGEIFDTMIVSLMLSLFADS